MELANYADIARQLLENGSVDLCLGPDTLFSLPVAARRNAALYDAMFLYEKPSLTSPRPFAWVLLDASTGKAALFSRCDIIDFVPAGRVVDDAPLAMELPRALSEKKRQALGDKLLAAYGAIRSFAFAESLTRQQAAVVSEYKECFQRLAYPAHYPFYHALSPAFFHWLRMPLPVEALNDPSQAAATDLQRDGYQLLILENLQQLVRQFQDKIAVDTHKEQLFDTMHRELQDYRNDLLSTLTGDMERDIIQVIDSVCKSVEVFAGKDGSPENFRRLLDLLAGVETDLCDLLYRHGVEPYTVDAVDVTRQKIIRTLPTDRPELDKTIAAHNARGWEKQGKIIRPERISVYVYHKEESSQ